MRERSVVHAMREVMTGGRTAGGRRGGKIGFHGGKVEMERPRLRSFEGKEQVLPSWEAAVAENWLGKWAMNQMLINVSTRKFARSVRLPEGDVPAPMGSGLSKSAASRRFVALSAARMKEWIASDLSGLDLLVIQIDGIHMDEDLILVAAIFFRTLRRSRNATTRLFAVWCGTPARCWRSADFSSASVSSLTRAPAMDCQQPSSMARALS